MSGIFADTQWPGGKNPDGMAACEPSPAKASIVDELWLPASKANAKASPLVKVVSTIDTLGIGVPLRSAVNVFVCGTHSSVKMSPGAADAATPEMRPASFPLASTIIRLMKTVLMFNR